MPFRVEPNDDKYSWLTDYVDIPDGGGIQPCGANTYSTPQADTNPKFSCTPCGAASETNEHGTYSIPGSSNCVTCSIPDNKFWNGSNCESCPATEVVDLVTIGNKIMGTSCSNCDSVTIYKNDATTVLAEKVTAEVSGNTCVCPSTYTYEGHEYKVYTTNDRTTTDKKCVICDEWKSWNGSSCVHCPAGHSRELTHNDGITTISESCQACPVNTYRAAESDNNGCLPCSGFDTSTDYHYYTTAEGSSSCTHCPLHKYYNSDSNDCTECVAGQYNPSGGSNVESCVECLDGEYRSAGMNSCSSDCPNPNVHKIKRNKMGCECDNTRSYYGEDPDNCVHCRTTDIDAHEIWDGTNCVCDTRNGYARRQNDGVCKPNNMNFCDGVSGISGTPGKATIDSLQCISCPTGYINENGVCWSCTGSNVYYNVVDESNSKVARCDTCDAAGKIPATGWLIDDDGAGVNTGCYVCGPNKIKGSGASCECDTDKGYNPDKASVNGRDVNEEVNCTQCAINQYYDRDSVDCLSCPIGSSRNPSVLNAVGIDKCNTCVNGSDVQRSNDRVCKPNDANFCADLNTSTNTYGRSGNTCILCTSSGYIDADGVCLDCTGADKYIDTSTNNVASCEDCTGYDNTSNTAYTTKTYTSDMYNSECEPCSDPKIVNTDGNGCVCPSSGYTTRSDDVCIAVGTSNVDFCNGFNGDTTTCYKRDPDNNTNCILVENSTKNTIATNKVNDSHCECDVNYGLNSDGSECVDCRGKGVNSEGKCRTCNVGDNEYINGATKQCQVCLWPTGGISTLVHEGDYSSGTVHLNDATECIRCGPYMRFTRESVVDTTGSITGSITGKPIGCECIDEHQRSSATDDLEGCIACTGTGKTVVGVECVCDPETHVPDPADSNLCVPKESTVAYDRFRKQGFAGYVEDDDGIFDSHGITADFANFLEKASAPAPV